MDYNQIVTLVWRAWQTVSSDITSLDVKHKNPYDFVTAVDIGISNFLKEGLRKLYPDVGFVTEEEEEHTLSDRAFILDPIDGTTNLVYDYRASSISLAYAEGGEVTFGVVYNPFLGDMFLGIRGKGSFLYDASNGIDALLSCGVENYCRNRLAVSQRPMKLSLIEFGASSSHKDMAEETFARGMRVFGACLDLRRICSTALAICYIAAGRLDGYFEKIIKPWDFAAACLILKEAGGHSSDWEGNPLPLDRPGTIICANAVILDELKKLM